MVAHFAKIAQRHVGRGDQRAALRPHKGQAGVGHRKFHAGAGQLVQPGAEGFAALLQPQFLPAAQVQRQRQKDAFDRIGQRLAQLQRKIKPGRALVQFDDDVGLERAGQGVAQPQRREHGAVLLAPDFLQLAGCQHGVRAADVAPQHAAGVLGRAGGGAVGVGDGGDLVQRRQERRGPGGQQVLAAALVDEGRHAVAGAAVEAEPAVLVPVGQAEGDGVVGVDDVAHALGPHVALPAVEGIGQRGQRGEGVGLLLFAGEIVHKGDAPPARVGRYLAGQLDAVAARDARAGEVRALDVKFHRLRAGGNIGGADFQAAGGVIVAQRIALFSADGPQQAAGGLVRGAGVAVFAHVEVQHHRVVRVGDGGGMAPGMLGVEQQIILGLAAEVRPFLRRVRVEAAGQRVAVLRGAVMFDGIGRRADAVGPPVGQIAVVDGAVLQFGGDGVVQLLQADHADGDAAGVAGGVAFDDAQNFRLGRGVVAEHAGHAGDDKVIRVAVCLALGQVAVQVVFQRRDGVGGHRFVAKKVLRHKAVDGVGF